MHFELRNPTTIRFGKGQISTVGELIPADAKVLLLYGGGSIRKNGVHADVLAALAGRELVEFHGVEANPRYETLRKASALARENCIDFVLGIGGGSVIDASKFLACMIGTGLDDPWDELVGDASTVVPLPNGAVLTLPATGSESNPVSVISSESRGLKIPFAYQAARPQFAILDPSAMASLSRRQLENGVVDAFTHVLEQYLLVPANAPIQFGYSETLLEVLAKWGPVAIETRSDEAFENIMWAANQALNGLIGAGLRQDWSTHMIGHAITALHGVDHARTLTMIMPSLLRYKLEQKMTMLARYGRRIWAISETDDIRAAGLAIDATERFMKAMGCPIRVSDEGITLSHEAVVGHLRRAGHVALGEKADITSDDVVEILRRAA